MNKVISTDKAPKAIGPYSQAYLCGNTLYCSGQIAINPETNVFVDGIFKIVGTDDLTGFDKFLDRLDEMGRKFNIKFEISVSIDADTAPDYIKKYA